MADWDRLKKRGVGDPGVPRAVLLGRGCAAQAGAASTCWVCCASGRLSARALIEKLPNLEVHGPDRRAGREPQTTRPRPTAASRSATRRAAAPTPRPPSSSWALLMMCARDLAKAERLMRSERLRDGIRADGRPRRQAAGRHRARPPGQPRRGLRQGLRHGMSWPGARTSRRRSAAKAAPSSSARTSCSKTSDFVSVHLVLVRPHAAAFWARPTSPR